MAEVALGLYHCLSIESTSKTMQQLLPLEHALCAAKKTKPNDVMRHERMSQRHQSRKELGANRPDLPLRK